MKIFFFSDVHWNTTSSLVRQRGEKYSVRLEYLVKSMNWVNELAKKENCGAMICAGDFFDKSRISDEELTALNDIKWNDLDCYFLCGNHESSVSDLRYNVLTALESANHYIITQPQLYNFDHIDILFLPTIVESNRKELKEYINDVRDRLTGQPLVIVSHNDLAGLRYANGIESKTGFNVDEIKENCVLYLNGHLHNSTRPAKNIINLGSFSGHNFTNDSISYEYGVWILDTETLKMEFIENPYGFNFYTFEIWKPKDIEKLSSIKSNAVLRISCVENLMPTLKDELERYTDKIIEKIITQVVVDDTPDRELVDVSYKLDYMAKLAELCRSTIPNSNILEEELSIICK